jgi:hypothetical protein
MARDLSAHSPYLLRPRPEALAEIQWWDLLVTFYAIISPIIIPFQVLIISLFWITYSGSSILLTEQDGGGLFYPKALKHLLIGLCMMQVCLIALFLLV